VVEAPNAAPGIKIEGILAWASIEHFSYDMKGREQEVLGLRRGGIPVLRRTQKVNICSKKARASAHPRTKRISMVGKQLDDERKKNDGKDGHRGGEMTAEGPHTYENTSRYKNRGKKKLDPPTLGHTRGSFVLALGISLRNKIKSRSVNMRCRPASREKKSW